MLTDRLASSPGARSLRPSQRQRHENQLPSGSPQGKYVYLSGPGPFVPLPFEPSLPFPDYVVGLAQKYPDREIAIILQDLSLPEAEASLISITWRKLLGDALHQAHALVQLTGLSPRKLGHSPVAVALLAQNNYRYFVILTAIAILRWTV